MKIAVISAFDAGSSYAHAINTVKMAEGFAKCGHEVHLITKEGQNNYEALKTQYGLSADIFWHFVPGRILGFLPVGAHKRFALKIQPVLKAIQPDFVYSRNYAVPSLTSKLNIPTAAETHAFVGNQAKPFLAMMKAARQFKEFRLISTISETLKDYYVSVGGPPEKICVLPDSVDTRLFSPSGHSISPYTGYGRGPHIVYSGHLYDYKGIPTILGAAKILPEYMFHFVGGHPDDIERQKNIAKQEGLENVVFHGLQPLSSVPPYLWHADILLLPPSADHPSAQWTSPVKLGEYCASRRPIISTDIPALRRWVGDKETFYVEADNAKSMAEGIGYVLSHMDSPEIQSRINAAAHLADEMTYEKRAHRILVASKL